MRLVAGLLAGASLSLAACGSVGPDERDDDFAKFSTAEVQKRFKELTGVRLVSSGYSTDVRRSLRVESTDGPASQRYGGVRVYVLGNEKQRDMVTDHEEESTKVFHNVVVQAFGANDTTQEALDRVSRVLASLGRPASTARLRSNEIPCARKGIDPDGGRSGEEGQCLGRDGGAVSIVNAGNPLRIEGAVISGIRAATGTTLTDRSFGETNTARARGAYVALSYAIENTGDEPLQSLQPGLNIDGRHYSEARLTSVRLGSLESFPIQPGARRRAATVFEIPTAAARKALRRGAFEYVGDLTRSVPGAEPAGRIRLDGAPKARRFGAATLSGRL